MNKRNNQLRRIESVENESIRSDEVLTVAAFRKRKLIGATRTDQVSLRHGAIVGLSRKFKTYFQNLPDRL